MSDYLKRGFRAQLASAMDAMLRTALCEITKIFETSLYDHQVELAQKGEEISRLQIKLEKAESKLKETGGGGDWVAEKDEMQREPEDVPNSFGQTSTVPEIDVEVPDDWCAPLGCDNMVVQPSWSRQEDSECPSVTLRPLSISLWHIPAIKQEVEDEDFESCRLTTLDKSPRKSKRCSSLDKRVKCRLKRIQDRSLPLPTPKRRGPGRPPGTKKVLRAIKQERPDPPVTLGGRQRGRDLKTEQGNVSIKSQAKRRKNTATESGSEGQETVMNDSEQTYSCKFCQKVFDTEFGRSVHIRSHKKCPGCRKMFPFPSALCIHKKSCYKLKRRSAAEKDKSIATPEQKLESYNEETPSSLRKTPIFVNKKSTPTSPDDSPDPVLKDTPGASKTTKKLSCRHCDKKFYSRFTLRDHMRLHTGEKPFACTVCPQTFRVKHSLKSHMFKAHKEQLKYAEANGDLAWTRPLEESEDNQVDSSSCSKDPGPAVKRQNVQLASRQHKKRKSIAWQTMGKQGSEGFICSVCERVLSSKYLLIEHFRIHTGEKPISCERCGATFRCRSQMSMHRSKCRGGYSSILCKKCGKTFPTQMKYNKHVVEAHKDWPNACQLCGKGFFTAGRLRNHYERVHV